MGGGLPALLKEKNQISLHEPVKPAVEVVLTIRSDPGETVQVTGNESVSNKATNRAG